MHATLLQFKSPKEYISWHKGSLLYSTGETICQKQFFNRSFLPTFFVFDNYMHAWAFEQKLGRVGYEVQKQKFK